MTILSGNFFEKLNHISERIIYLGYLNFLWILFSIIGLGVLGIFPATVAIFAVYRQEKIHERTPSFKQFFSYYKDNFWRANIIGWILGIFGYILYLDFYLITFMEGSLADILYSGVFAITILFFLVSFYIFPIYTHYSYKIRRYFLYSLITVVTRPIQTILIAIVSLVHIYIMLRFHVLIPFFGVSLWALLVTHITQAALNKNVV